MKKILPITFIIIIIVITFIFVFIFTQSSPPVESKPHLVSPLASNTPKLLPQTSELSKIATPQENIVLSASTKKEVIGFLPFWLLDQYDSIPYQNLTQIAYFGLGVEGDGSFVTHDTDGTEEPGANKMKSDNFQKMKEKAKSANVKVLLTLRLMTRNEIEKLLKNPNAQEKLINNTLATLKSENLDGVNIDFEYEGSPEEDTIKSLTRFAKTMTEKVHQEIKDGVVSVATYGDSAYKVRVTEIWPLSQVTDHIIIMGYDFFRPSSETSGPISPLTGAGEKYEYDITQTIKDYLKLASSEKIVLGLPFYGYDWTTDKKEPYGNSLDFAALSSFTRTKKLLEEKKLKENWDDTSQTPYLTYQDEEGINHQVFYDNEKSFGLKLDLIKKADLAGLAIWALGYEGNYKDYWNVISEKLK